MQHKNNVNLDSRLERKLHSALRYATRTCLLADNKISDLDKSNDWPTFLRERYSARGHYVLAEKLEELETNPSNVTSLKLGSDEFYQEYSTGQAWDYLSKQKNGPKELSIELNNPEYELSESLRKWQQSLFGPNMLTKERRYGNCGDRSRLVVEYLWKNCEDLIDRILLVTTSTFDHGFVIVIPRESLNQKTYIIDAWYGDGEKTGIIYPVDEFDERIKEIKNYVRLQGEALERRGEEVGQVQMKPEVLAEAKIRLDICPNTDKYPSCQYPVREGKIIVKKEHPVVKKEATVEKEMSFEKEVTIGENTIVRDVEDWYFLDKYTIDYREGSNGSSKKTIEKLESEHKVKFMKGLKSDIEKDHSKDLREIGTAHLDERSQEREKAFVNYMQRSGWRKQHILKQPEKQKLRLEQEKGKESEEKEIVELKKKEQPINSQSLFQNSKTKKTLRGRLKDAFASLGKPSNKKSGNKS